MDRMKTLCAALLCGLVLTVAAQADTVLPRLSPLAMVDADGRPTGETVAIPFGTPLELLEGTATEGPVAQVRGPHGTTFSVRATDLIAPVAMQAGLMAMAEPGRDSGLRPEMPMWDSVARARSFLQGAGQDSLRPVLTERPGGVFPAQGLPVFAVERAPTTIGQPVTLVGAWVPVLPEALDSRDIAASRKVVLHVLVDGSDYARDFTLESLQQVSRALAQSDRITSFSRHVIYEDGTVHDDGEVAVAGLRAEWPKAGRGTGASLTDALAAALDGLATRIMQGDGAAHVVLVLVGPGLGSDPLTLGRVKAAREKLGDLRGVVLVQGTPEPNPANDSVLRQIAGGTAARFLDFGGDVIGAVEGVLSSTPKGGANALAEWRGKVCTLAAKRALPCVIAAPGVLPPVPAAEWVALPLWFVIDGAALELVPAGMAPAAAREAQNAIRACHAAGRVWDAAAADCTAMSAPMPDNTQSLRADLAALQSELSTRSQERDVALDDLARKTAAWNEQRNRFRAKMDKSMAELADAQTELDRRGEIIAVQKAKLWEQAASVADLTDLADVLKMSVSRLQTERDAAVADAAQRGRDLADRDAALRATNDQLADLIATRDSAFATLARTQEDLGVSQAKAKGLASDLALEQSARAFAEATLAQERADWQLKAEEAAATFAELVDKQAILGAQVTGLTGQLGDQTAARIAAETALSNALVAAAQAAAEADAAAKLALAQLSAAQAASAAAGAERDDLAARLSAQTLRADDLEAMKRDLSLAEGDIRADHASVTRQLAKARAELTELDTARTAALARTATMQAALTDAQAQGLATTNRLAALQAERDALAKQVATAQREAAEAVQGLTDRLAEAEVKVARLTADLAAAAKPGKTTAPEDDAMVHAVTPTVKPKARPGANAATAAKMPKQTAPAPSKPAIKAAAAAPVPSAPQPLPTRKITPASDARQLRGCQFQWLGQEGRLVCP